MSVAKCGSVGLAPPPMSKEEMKALGYPQPPAYMEDPNWWTENFEKEKVDPRANPCLNLDINSQEFWNAAMRKPWAKQILREDQFKSLRKNNWLDGKEAVDRFNMEREEVGELLEECPVHLKKLVAPMMKYKICEKLLWNVKRESVEYGVPFQDLMLREETTHQLHELRRMIDTGGEAAAKDLDDQLTASVIEQSKLNDEEKEREKKERGRIYIDMQGLKTALEWGQKCKKDGLLEWEKGEYMEALRAWDEGDTTMKRFRAPHHCIQENQMLYELHGAVLRNVAQACIKLERWSHGLDAAERALEIDDQDHKAWFRKACVLEGLGRIEEAEKCIEKIEEIAVGRKDRTRLIKDCQAKKDKLQAVRDRNHSNLKKIMTKGFQNGIFGEDRKTEVAPPPELRNLPTPEEKPKVQKDLEWAGSLAPTKTLEQAERKRITKDGAQELLEALEEEYGEAAFQQRIDKLAKDVRLDCKEFLANLKKVAFEVQKPILERWGFELNPRGVMEMQAAIRDHTEKDGELKALSEKVLKLLYGSPELGMYKRVHG